MNDIEIYDEDDSGIEFPLAAKAKIDPSTLPGRWVKGMPSPCPSGRPKGSLGSARKLHYEIVADILSHEENRRHLYNAMLEALWDNPLAWHKDFLWDKSMKVDISTDQPCAIVVTVLPEQDRLAEYLSIHNSSESLDTGEDVPVEYDIKELDIDND